MRISILMLPILALAGCGDSSSFDSGLPPDRPISQLSNQDVQDFCEATMRHVSSVFSQDRMKRAFCTIAGATAEAITRADGQCEISRDQCLAEEHEIPDLGEFDCSEGSAAGLGDCDHLTVRDMERCIDVVTRTWNGVFERVTCAELGGDTEAADALTEELGELFDEENLPESCRTLRDECPGATIFG